MEDYAKVKYDRLMASLDKAVMHTDQKGQEKVLYDMSDLPKETKKDIKAFVQSRRAAAVSKTGITDNYLLVILSLHEALGKFTLDNITEAKVMSWLDYHTDKEKFGWGQNTKHSRWTQGLKVILHWYFEEYEKQPPKWFRNFKVQRGGDRVTEQNVLKRDEIIQLADAMPTLMGRAYVRTAFESNARCSEMLALRIEDMKFLDGHIKANVPLSKTRRVGQQRELLIIESYPAMMEWVKCHPTGEGFVFSGTGGKTAIDKYNLNRSLKAGAKRAGITKPVSSHRLRHSGISDDLLRGLSEIEVSRKTGYSKKSVMVSQVYGHISTQDVTAKEMILAGLKPQKANAAGMVKCIKCSSPNSADALHCFRCGDGLTQEARKVVQETQKGEIGEMKKEMQEMKAMIGLLQHEPIARAKSPKELMSVLKQYK